MDKHREATGVPPDGWLEHQRVEGRISAPRGRGGFPESQRGEAVPQVRFLAARPREGGGHRDVSVALPVL